MEIEMLPEVIIEDIKKYTEEKTKKISEAVRDCTEMAYKDITDDSPVRKRVPDSGVVLVHGEAKANYQPGSYKKGWMTFVKTYDRGRTQGYVRNKTNYQLTHLLENGHDLVRGGRKWVKGEKNGSGKVYGHVDPIPHIVDNQNKAREELDRMIEEILEE